MTIEEAQRRVDAAEASLIAMAQRAGTFQVALTNAHVEHCRTACPAQGRDVDPACRCGLTRALRLLEGAS